MSAMYTVTYVGVHYFVMLEYFDGSHTDPHTVHTIHIHCTLHSTCTYSTSVIEQEGHLVGGWSHYNAL